MNNAINGKRRALRLGTGIATCISSVFLAHTAFGQALPELANAGGANISTVGNTLTVDALANNRVINWNTFSVDAGNTVNFVSTAASVTDATPVTVVNRVIGMDVMGTQTFFPSYINGSINSSNGGNNNISVWLINPSGITFGPTGAFSGGSLVVSSLDFISPETGADAFSGTSVRLQRKTLGASEALGIKNDVDGNSLTAMEIKLVPGAGTIATEGSLVLLGEQINIGKDVDANGEVLIVAASDVSFTPTTGSPISFNILAGTEMGGVQVLGTGEVNGRNIVVAASNATNTISTLLQVDTGGRLIASADNGAVTLTTSSDPIVGGDPVAGANIASQGLLSTTGLNGEVTVRSNASATVARIAATGDVLVQSGAGASDSVAVGTVQTDGGIDVTSTGDLTLGIAGTETILAGGAIDLESTGGAINSTAADLTIRSNRADAGTGALTINAVNAIDLGDATLAGGLGSNRTAAVTVVSDTGSVEIGVANASKFTGTTATTFTANGAVNGGNSTAPAGNAVSITAASGITLTTARALGTDQNLRLTTGGAVVADVLSADNIVTIGSIGAPVSSLTVNTDLIATTGNINAFAGSMSVAAATAGGNVTLRSDGAIAVTGKVEAGDTLLAKGIATDYAASFTAGTAQANTGSVTATADAIDVGALRAGTTGSLQGKTSIALGSGLVDGNLTVETDLDNAAGDIALGAAGASSIVSDGRITVKSTFGAVNRGAGSTSLTLRSNADDVGTDALSVTANNAVTLGNARLYGGTVPSAAVTVTSTTSDVTLGTVNATKFTGTALAGTFTATGSITADNSAVGAGNAIQIDAADIALTSARTNGADQDIRLTTTGAVDAAAINASRNIVISSLGSPASRIGSATLKPILTAGTGSISAFAGAMTFDKATAATSISLRSDGAISADGAFQAGTNLTVSGVSGTHAAAFAAPAAEATAGAISISAGAIDLASAVSGTSTTLDALVAGGTIAIGSVDAGTNYTANATGTITLGRLGAKTQTAGGAITIGSTTSSINSGVADLTVQSNNDGVGGGDLTLSAGTNIVFGSSTALVAGDPVGTVANRSDVIVTTGAAGLLQLGDVTAKGLHSSGDTKLVQARDIILGDVLVDNSLTVISNTRSVQTGDVTVRGAGNSLSITATVEDVLTGALVAAGAITVDAGDNVSLASADAGGMLSVGANVLPADLTIGGAAKGSGVDLNALGTVTLSSVTATAGSIAVASTNGNVTATGAVDATVDITVATAGVVRVNALDAGGNVTVKGTGAGFAASLAAIGGVNGTAIDAGSAISVKAGEINVASAMSGTTTALDAQVAGGTIVIGTVSAGTDYSALANGNITLGREFGFTQTANGKIDIVSATGSVLETTANIPFSTNLDGLLLRANRDGNGAEALTVSAGDMISLARTTMSGSNVFITSVNDATIARVYGQNIEAIVGGEYAVDPTISLGENSGATVNYTINAGSVATDTLTAGGNLTITSPGSITGFELRGGTVTIKGIGTGYAGPVTLQETSGQGALVRSTSGAVDIKASSMVLQNVVSATSVSLDAAVGGGTIHTGAVTAGTDYVATADSTITIGRGSGKVQSAGGKIEFTAGGSIINGTSLVELTSNADGIGTEAMTLNAGDAISLGNTILHGGTMQTSDISLASVNDTTIDEAFSANFSSTAGGAFTADLVNADGDASITAGSVTAKVIDATGQITVTSAGAVNANTLMAGGDVIVDGVGSGHAASLASFNGATGAAITAGSAISVKAGAINVASATSGTSTTLDAVVAGGTIAVGSVDAGTDYVANATGDITLGRAGATTQTAGGTITIGSATGSISEGVVGFTLTSNDDDAGGEALTLDAGNAIALGRVTLRGGATQTSDVSLTSANDTTIDTVLAANAGANAGGLFTANLVDANGNAMITAGSVAAKVADATGDITVTSAGAVQANTLIAGGNVAVNGTGAGHAASLAAIGGTMGSAVMAGGAISVKAGAINVASATSGTSTTLDAVVAGGTIAVGSVDVGTDYVANATGDITLGRAGNKTQTATGAIAITSTGGSISEGTTGLALTSNDVGGGTSALTLNAGSTIGLGTAMLNGGPGNQSVVSVTSGAGTTVGTVNSAAFTANAGTTFTANDAITAAGTAAITAGGAVTLDTVTTQGAGTDIVVTSPGAVAAGTLLAARNATVGGQSGGNAASFTGSSVTATAGSIAVRAGATDVGAATSGIDTTVSGTTATLGTVSAGGNYAVTTTGAITLGKAGGQTQAAKGTLTLTSSAGAIQQGANGLTLTSNSDGAGTEALTLNAKTDINLPGATLKGGSAKQSAVSLTSGGDTVVGSVLGATLTANAGGAFETRGSIDAVTDVAITSVGAITLNGPVTAGNAVNLKASNATIGADVTAKTIDVFNSGAASGKLAIGDEVTTAAADFALSAAEVSRLRASDTLTLGSDAAHNVEIGRVQFTVPKMVNVSASAKRIDVTGRITFDADTTLKLGSSDTTIIQLSTTKGGSIASDGGVLELSAANIVSGADDFAADLSAVSGNASATGSRDAAFAMNLNPGSKLYNPTTINNDVMIDVGSMKVNFTGFALFQNTGNSLVGAGVKLGNGNSSSLALDIGSGSTQPVFAAFGSINGIINAATALLGNPPLAHYDNISASRLNGCVIGGGNCQSVQNLTPSLTALDNIRTSIFTVKPDFQVPFDPLVGTNNDALFDDVGSFGLGELPMTPIECSDPNGSCDAQKKDGN